MRITIRIMMKNYDENFDKNYYENYGEKFDENYGLFFIVVLLPLTKVQSPNTQLQKDALHQSYEKELSKNCKFFKIAPQKKIERFSVSHMRDSLLWLSLLFGQQVLVATKSKYFKIIYYDFPCKVINNFILFFWGGEG